MRKLLTILLTMAVMAVGVVGFTAPAASAATCTYSYDRDGFPKWSRGCSTVVSPGKFGPLRMGHTTVTTAKKTRYLAYNKFCSRWDGVGAHSDWRSKGGKLTAWAGGTVTTKGLRPNDSWTRVRKLYPSLKRTGFMQNHYVRGEGWRIFSVKTKDGWLDFYRYNKGTRNEHFFAVRANSVTKPITSWSQDGC